MTCVLTSFPGRCGDLIWALPTIRAISESYAVPVDLLICGEFAGMVPLLAPQPYLARVVADPDWGIGHGWQPPNRADVISPYDKIFHLGYRRWPELPLPLEVDQTVRVDRELPPLDLTRPWITAPLKGPLHYHLGRRIAVGFSECHFELKYGLLGLLGQHDSRWEVQTVMGPSGRWGDEAGEGMCNWEEAAHAISQAEVFVGDCSALHVLAVALGKPCVLVEPMEARHNAIFWPLGQEGPQVTLVRGLDGKPTWDSRHLCETVAARLEAIDATP